MVSDEINQITRIKLLWGSHLLHPCHHRINIGLSAMGVINETPTQYAQPHHTIKTYQLPVPTMANSGFSFTDP